MRRILIAVAVGALLLGASWNRTPEAVDRALNRVSGRPGRISEHARQLHDRLAIADLHADTLLWGRSFVVRHSFGHVDLPRLEASHVKLITLAAATSMPRGGGAGDRIGELALAQRWPPATRTSPFERALFLARRLDEAVRDSRGRLAPIRTREDLAQLTARKPGEVPGVGAVLSLEGAHALEGDLDRLEALASAGYRIIGLTHFFDNDVAGSANGKRRGGLTPAGRELVRRIEARQLIVDLAHASPQTVADVLAIATRPVVVSHTGVRAMCDKPRNLSDAELRAVVRNGGVIGIGFWPEAVCGSDPAAIARSIRHAVDVAGIDHVGLGSDFDGATSAPFDVTGLPALTQALIDAGFTDTEIAKIMGGNTLRLLASGLPSRQ